MKTFVSSGLAVLFALSAAAHAQDWPEWRGPHRAARATGFSAPEDWPDALTQGWSVEVGDGVATPALVGDRLYVFAWQNGQEILRCLDAKSGDVVWSDEYAAEGADGAARSFAGPRACPTVADGYVVTYGVRGALSCYDAKSGELKWRKTEYSQVPRFYTSSSPLIAEGLCIAQLGGESEGMVLACDLDSGDEVWAWEGTTTAYSSPILWETGGQRQLVLETVNSVVGLDLGDGSVLWETPFVVRGRGYNASTPIVRGDTLVLTGSGRGTRSMALEKGDAGLAAKELWANEENSVQFNTPVLKDDMLYGLTDGGMLFAVDAKSGATAWTAATAKASEEDQGGDQGGGGGQRGGGFGRGGGRGGRGGGMGGGGFGCVVDAGPVLIALTPTGDLIVFEPGKSFLEVQRYKVAEAGTYAYPILSGNRIFVKDQARVTLWTLSSP